MIQHLSPDYNSLMGELLAKHTDMPIYRAHDEGIPVHVWVDETRPRMQGSRLTAYELGEEGMLAIPLGRKAG